MADLTVAKTIFEQLGGERFVAMTGAKDFVGTEDSLTFKVGSNPKHVSHVRVTQTPGDLYAVTFFRRGKAPRIMDGICCDTLQEVFTDNTGLYISLLASGKTVRELSAVISNQLSSMMNVHRFTRSPRRRGRAA